MRLEPLAVVDTRGMFGPASRSFVAVLRQLAPQDWQRPTIAANWLVRDVVAHLLDTTLRRLSFHRDGMIPSRPSVPLSTDRDLADFINRLNAQWVGATQRLSPRVLTDLYERSSREAAEFFESLPLEGQALFPVSWAGEQESASWFDIGREFTEVWHHQQQVRMAVGANSPPDPLHLHAVLDIAVRGLPHAYRAVAAKPGTSVVVDVTGPAGGQWTLTRAPDRWTLMRGEQVTATARLRLDQDAAWKLLFNALPESEAAPVVEVSGDTELARVLWRARSVIV